ncbi:MAG: hypothetical protein AAGH90_09225 [Pseudomonadota bacterium]
MREYSFKPAMAQREATWMVRDGHLLKRGAERALKLYDVTSVAWGDMTYRGTRNAWLHLTGPDGVVKIECNDAGFGDDRHTFLKLCESVCQVLAAECPDLPIRQGGGRALQWSMFLLGAMAAGVGVLFLWAVLSGTVRQNEVTVGLLGAFMAAAFGYVAWIFAPWQPVQTLSPREMALYLSGMTAPVDRPEDDA